MRHIRAINSESERSIDGSLFLVKRAKSTVYWANPMVSSFYPAKLYLKHLPISLLLLAGLFLNLLIWGWLLWNIRPQADPVFLHYTILFGVDLTGQWYKVLVIPLSGLLILLVNTTVGWIFFNVDRFISYVCGSASILAHVFLLVAAWLLVYLNV